MKTIYIFNALLIACSLFSCGHKTVDEWREVCDSMADFHDGYARCYLEGKYFFIDETGKKCSNDYDEAEDFSNNYAIVKNQITYRTKQIIFLDKDCKEKQYPVKKILSIVNPKGNVWGVFGEGPSHNIYGLFNIDTGSFRVELESENDFMGMTDDGTAVLCKTPEVGSIDYINEFRQFGIVDAEGQWVVPYGKYSYIAPFSNGLAKYSTTGNVSNTFASLLNNELPPSNQLLSQGYYNHAFIGFINPKGEIVIPEKYHHAMDFNAAGYARVDKGDHYILDNIPYKTVIDKQGNELSGKAYTMAMATFCDDGKWIKGRDDKGTFFLANNKGEEKYIDAGSDLAIVSNIVASKKGNIYKFYRITDNDIESLFTLQGTGKSNEIVCTSTPANTIEVYNGNSYDEFDLDGKLISSGTLFHGQGPLGLIRPGQKVNSGYEHRTFFFD